MIIKMMVKRIAKIVSGVVFFAYWAWVSMSSFEAFSRGDTFGWEHFAALLIPEIILALIFFYLLWPGKDSPDVSSKFLSVFSMLIVAILWVIGPLQSFFTLNLDNRGISFSAFLYSFEVMLFGGLFLFIIMRYLGQVRLFLKDYSSNIKSITHERAEKFSTFLSNFPLKVGRLGFIFTFGGYLLSAPQLIFWGHTASEAAVKSIFIGLAISPVIALLMYILARRFLSGVYEILYSFGEVSHPKLVLSIGGKVMMLGSCIFLMAVSLLLPLVWNFFEENIGLRMFLLGCGLMLLELIFVFFFSVKAFVYDITSSLDILKKGLEIHQTGEKRYRINMRTGDELEDVIDEFNKIPGTIDRGSGNNG